MFLRETLSSAICHCRLDQTSTSRSACTKIERSGLREQVGSSPTCPVAKGSVPSVDRVAMSAHRGLSRLLGLLARSAMELLLPILPDLQRCSFQVNHKYPAKGI